MTRKSNNTPKRDWRQVVLIILSLFLILSMTLGYVLPYLLPK